MDRSKFLKAISYSSVGLLIMPAIESCLSKNKKKFQGEIAGANSAVGHKLRENNFDAPASFRKVRYLILGAGVAGLAAARMLHKKGETDFVVIDLAGQPGGNAASGKNEVSSYPRGAHYLPAINKAEGELFDFLNEHEIIQGVVDEKIIYNPLHLCAEPEERLHIQGHWQHGLIPSVGLNDGERQEITSFLSLMETYRFAKGSDGKYAFDIPLDQSSDDPAFTVFDHIDMKAWLENQGWRSRYLHWYVNYCCKDDYGAAYDQTSAWAGIHYFASRRGQVQGGSHEDILTWPEGNQFLIQKLITGFGEKIQLSELVFSMTIGDKKTFIETWQEKNNSVVQYEAESIICCLPRYVIKRLMPEIIVQDGYLPEYTPWMVANLTVKGEPATISGESLCWDNVLFNSESLGYVNACHQQIRVYNNKNVLTYYIPLVNSSPQEARKLISSKTHEDWCKEIMQDLEYAHPEISRIVENVEIWLWGHGMARPKPGFYVDTKRRKARESYKQRIFFAHSDLSGISIFEEAFYHGNRAATEAIQSLSTNPST
jgi:hypothetical protein